MICETCGRTKKRSIDHTRGQSLRECVTRQQTALGRVECSDVVRIYNGATLVRKQIAYRRTIWGHGGGYRDVTFGPEWAVLLFEAEREWAMNLKEEAKESAHGKAAWVAAGSPDPYTFYYTKVARERWEDADEL